MEEITMERLLSDFNGVINDFNELVAKKDIEGVRKALSEVENLVNTATDVELDQLEDPNSDHILHHLLRHLDGYIERETGTPGTPGRYVISEEFRVRYEALEIEERELIARLRGYYTPGRGQAGNNEIDEEIAKLRNQISFLEAEIERLEDELTQSDANDTVLIGEQLTDLYRQLEEARKRLAELDAQRSNFSAEGPSVEELDKQIAELQVQLKASADYMDRLKREGLYDREAEEHAEFNRLTVEINRLTKQRETLLNSRQPSVEELDKQIAELQAQLKASADYMDRLKREGLYDREAEEHAEFNRLTIEINRLTKQREEIIASQQPRTVEGVRRTTIEQMVNNHNARNQIAQLRVNIQTHQNIINRLILNESVDGGKDEQVRANEDKIAEFEKQIAALEATIVPIENELEIGAIIPELQQLLDNSNPDLEYIPIEEINKIIEEYAKRREELAQANNTETQEVLFEDYYETSNPEEQLQRIARELNIDPSELQITWYGADEYDDGPATSYRIVRNGKSEAEKNKEIEELDTKIGQLRGVASLSEKFVDRTNPPYPGAELDEEMAKLEATIAYLEAMIEALRDQMRDANEQEQPGIAEEIENLRRQLEEARKRLAELEAKKAALGITGKTPSEEKLDLEEQLKASAERMAEYRRVGAYDQEAEEHAEYNRLVKRIQEIEDEQKKNPNYTLIIEIEERLRKIRIEKLEIIRKSRTDYIQGTPGTASLEAFDVTEEVNRIGDKIFKTAKIRRELEARGVTREEFLEFYKNGRQVALDNIENLNAEAEKIANLVQDIFVDEEGSLYDLSKEAKDNSDEAKQIELCERIRQNFLKTNEFSDEILQKEIKTKADADEFMIYIEAFKKSFDKQFKEISENLKEQKENVNIFNQEIKIIEDELKTLEALEDNKGDIEAEKALRARQIRASMFGDEELEQEWNEKFERFYGHKQTKTYEYVDKDGETKTIEYQTIEDYPEIKDDAYFLNLKEYKMNLELVSKYRASGGDIYALGPIAVQKFEEAVRTKGEEKALEDFHKNMAKMEKYVDTFHGHANEKKVKYEVYKTAGSTLKSMIPIKNLPPAKKAGAIATNVFRFFGLRAPQFSRIDDHGNKVSDIGGGLKTLALDALVVGAVGLTAASPLGWSAVAIGYGAKGVVTIGNRVAGRITRNRNEFEVENNTPDLFLDSKDSREVARKAYYRAKYKEETGKEHKFLAWLKAKNDRFFARRRARETEEKIVAERIALSDQELDEGSKTLKENLEILQENQRIREENYRKTVRSARTQNDIVKDPDSVDIAQTEEIIAQNAAVGMYKDPTFNVNPNSKVENTDQYVKKEEELGLTKDLGEIKSNTEAIANTAITEEQHYTGRQQKQDRINKVWTIILTTAGKLGLDALKNRFNEEYQLPDSVEKKPVTKEVTETKDIVEQQTTIESPDDLSNYDLSNEVKDNVYEGTTTSFTDDITSTNGLTNLDNTAGVAIRYVDSNGNEIVSSIAENGTGFGLRHVHGLNDFDGAVMHPSDVIEQFKQTDPDFFNRIIKDLGMENADNMDIWNELGRRGTIHLQGDDMAGWQLIKPENFIETTKDVVVGTEDVVKTVTEMQDVVIPGEMATRISTSEIGKSALEGAAIGAGIAATETLHEANRQTRERWTEDNNPVRPGTFEESAEKSYFDRIIGIGLEKIHKEKKAKVEAEEEPEKE